MTEYRIDYTLQRREGYGSYHFDDIGYGSSDIRDSMGEALGAVTADIQNHAWQTDGGEMPKPQHIDVTPPGNDLQAGVYALLADLRAEFPDPAPGTTEAATIDRLHTLLRTHPATVQPAREALREAIVTVRDASPRRSDDANTDDIIDAVTALLPGATEREVEARTLNSAATDLEAMGNDGFPALWLRERTK